ncbi:hypothetical protein IT072_02610 [Leifsonia sp. ZF2019]|uniref:hypothetical protein n=1 Tax=Leifsonia sp. ZF2019 TaxID=2781978 RepID=UPI001CBD4E72|nr:hypothetical protein [Leifsonia sp. ZF2019]UAJ79989.1 hypothetical protein IT072_02610 [Leifsonia sp. ZF2019]
MNTLAEVKTTTQELLWADGSYVTYGPLNESDLGWYRERGYSIRKTTRIETVITEGVPE